MLSRRRPPVALTLQTTGLTVAALCRGWARRLAAGRIAEFMGEAGLTVDRFSRTMGWGKLAEEEWASMLADPAAAAPVAVSQPATTALALNLPLARTSPALRSRPGAQMLEAFAEGVNAFIEAQPRGSLVNGSGLPFQYLLTGLVPEPWRPQDSLGILRVRPPPHPEVLFRRRRGS